MKKLFLLILVALPICGMSQGAKHNLPTIGVNQNVQTWRTIVNGNFLILNDSVHNIWNKLNDNFSDTSSVAVSDLFNNISLTGVPTAPTATIGTNTTQVATTAFVQAALSGASGSSSNFIEALTYLGSTVKVLPLGFSYDIPNSQTLTSGQLLLIAIYCSKSEILSSVSFYVATAGVYTGNNYNGVGLYTYNSGTLSLVASSTTSSTLFTQGSSKITAAFTTPYSAVKGVYYVGLIYSSSAQTTAPSIRASQTWGSYVNKLDFTNSAVLYGSLDSQTSLPSTINMSSVSVYSNSPFITVQ